MKYCSNCGSQVADGSSFCSNCGGFVSNDVQGTQQSVEQPTMQQNAYQQPTMQQNVYQQPGMQQNAYQQPGMQQNVKARPSITERNIVLQIVLSLVTCGLYAIYWLLVMTDDSNALSENNKTASGGMTILLIFLTCGIYTYYWFYKMGKKLHEAGMTYGRNVSDNSVLYLILALFGFGIVDYCMIQSDLNKFAK